MMKRIVITAALLLVLVGCVGLKPELLDTSVQNITLRHDRYVTADPALTADQRAAFLQESELLRLVIEEAKK